MIGEDGEKPGSECCGVSGEAAAADHFQQAQIAFFLAGHEVVDEHRAMGGNGLVDGGPTGLANDEVVVGEQIGDAAGPAHDADAAGEGLLELAGGGVQQFGVFAEHQGQAHGG